MCVCVCVVSSLPGVGGLLHAAGACGTRAQGRPTWHRQLHIPAHHCTRDQVWTAPPLLTSQVALVAYV